MLNAVRGNVVYIIAAEEADRYQADGFDIVEISPEGQRTIVRHGKGKTVPYDKYLEAVDRAKRAEETLKAFKGLVEQQKAEAKAKPKPAAKKPAAKK